MALTRERSAQAGEVVPRIVVAMVNYNSSDQAVAMIASARKLRRKPELVVLDNSKEASPRLQEAARAGEIEYRHTERNRGYYGAVAWWLAKDNWSEVDWLFIANPDMVFHDSGLFDHLSKDGVHGVGGRVGLYGPRIWSTARNIDQNPHRVKRPRQRDLYKHLILTSWAPFGHIYRWRERKSKTKARSMARFDEPTEVFAVQGSFIGFHCEFLKRCSIPTDAFLFLEEEIVGVLCADAGLRTVYDPRVSIAHDEHKALGDPYRPELLRHRHRSVRALMRYLKNSQNFIRA